MIAHAFGWDWSAGLIFGTALAVASTVVLIRVLADQRDLHTPTGHIAVGWLVVEDLFTVLALVLVPAFFHDAGPGSSLLTALGVTVLKVAFFVAVGMLLDPRALLESPALIAATLAVVLVGKPVAALVIVRVLGYPFRVALSVAVALAQIGEFSFILSSLGRELGILTREASNTIVGVSIISIVLNPILYVWCHVLSDGRPRVRACGNCSTRRCTIRLML